MSDLLTPQHKTLLEYWRLRAGRKALPSREDIRPEDVPSLLKHLGLIDVVHGNDRLRFKYRLVGTQMSFVLGKDVTGTWLHELKFGEYRDYLDALFSEAVTMRRPVYSHTEFGYADNRRLEVKRLIMPLSADGEAVNMLLFSNLFHSDDADFGHRPYPPGEILDFSEGDRRAA
ncbi:MAG: PAS domain-containing protein [Minwuia sp.]|uniref:PAS domain-containing protein n=1 Tax=Minwuia sp. TaxID=2493630 RepID=UPI003A83CFDB